MNITNKREVSLNQNLKGMGISATLVINERTLKLQKKGKHIYRFGLGQSPFPVPKSVQKALRDNAYQKDYLPVRGLPALRKAVANYHSLVDNVDIDQDYVMIGPGSKELMFLLQLVFNGEILIPTPCWVSYQPQAKIIGRNVRFIPTSYQDRWRLTSKRLEVLLKQDNNLFRPRLLILNYPGNPEGQTYTQTELKQLAEIARKHQLLILSDEIYGRLHHEGSHISIARFYPEGTIISSGLSKWCGAGGWRLGTFAFPKELNWILEPMTVIASETYTSVCAPIQYAAVTAFNGNTEINQYLIHSRRILKTIGNTIYNKFHSAGINIHAPIGAFYLFPDFSNFKNPLSKRKIFDSETFCEKLLQDTGVAFLPGSVFGRPLKEMTARLAYVNFDGAQALKDSMSVPISEKLNRSHLGNNILPLLKGIDKLIDWLQ